MMKFNFKITDIHEYYRISTKEWVVWVNIQSDNVSACISYPAKKLIRARAKMLRKLPYDMAKYELEYRMKEHEFDKYMGDHT